MEIISKRYHGDEYRMEHYFCVVSKVNLEENRKESERQKNKIKNNCRKRR